MPEPSAEALTVARQVLDQLAGGDIWDADRRIRQAAHTTVTPVDLALAFHALGRQEVTP